MVDHSIARSSIRSWSCPSLLLPTSPRIFPLIPLDDASKNSHRLCRWWRESYIMKTMSFKYGGWGWLASSDKIGSIASFWKIWAFGVGGASFGPAVGRAQEFAAKVGRLRDLVVVANCHMRWCKGCPCALLKTYGSYRQAREELRQRNCLINYGARGRCYIPEYPYCSYPYWESHGPLNIRSLARLPSIVNSMILA